MTAAALLGALTLQGVALANGGDYLEIFAPRPLKPRVLDAIRCHKSELLELLQLETVSQMPSQTSTRLFDAPTEAREFAAQVRRIRRNLPACMVNAPDAEKRKYATVAACLACGIDPRGVP